MKTLTEQSYYELLEVSPSATREEILAAYQRATRLYDAESVALYPVGDPTRVEELKKLMREAVEVLSDPELRVQYDKGLGIASPPQPPRAGSAADENNVNSNAAPLEGEARNGVAPAPRESDPEAAEPTNGVDARDEPPSENSPSATQGTHPSGAGFSVSYLPKLPPATARSSPPRLNEIASTSRLSLGPPTAAGPELRSLAPVLPLPSDTDAAAAGERWFVAPTSAPRPDASAPSGVPDQPLPTGPRAFQPDGARPGNPIGAPLPSGSDLPPASRTPANPASGSSGTSPRRALESAPVLAQESAIADAESALAHAHAQVAQRTRESRPRSIEIPQDATFNGELLRYVRKARGMSLQILAERTRISTKHIENLEADRYEALPATVYLRGIVMSVARELGLDPLRVSKGYLALVEKQIGRK